MTYRIQSIVRERKDQYNNIKVFPAQTLLSTPYHQTSNIIACKVGTVGAMVSFQGSIILSEKK